MRRTSPADHGQTGRLELARERAALDQELDFDAGRQDLVEHPDDQIVLANRQTPHMSELVHAIAVNYRLYASYDPAYRNRHHRLALADASLP